MHIWIRKEISLNNIAVISDDAIITGNLKSEELEEAKAKIEAGESPLNVIGKNATHIPFFNVTGVEFDAHEEEIEISYKAEKESKTKSLEFADKADRTEAFQLIENRLGDSFTSLTESFSKLCAVYAPLLTLTIFGFLTWLLHNTAAEIAAGAEAEVTGRHRGIKALFLWILDLIGPIGVLIIGGLLMALAVMALVQRFKEPPIITKLKQGVQKPSRGIGTVIKYAILAGIWYLFIPALFSSLFA
jgi:hypothetical protein